jgi:hypothetical protein
VCEKILYDRKKKECTIVWCREKSAREDEVDVSWVKLVTFDEGNERNALYTIPGWRGGLK